MRLTLLLAAVLLSGCSLIGQLADPRDDAPAAPPIAAPVVSPVLLPPTTAPSVTPTPAAPALTIVDAAAITVTLEGGSLLLTTPAGQPRPTVRIGGCPSGYCGVTLGAGGLLLPEAGLRVTAAPGLVIEVFVAGSWTVAARYGPSSGAVH
jgi:hypothetical protein